MIKLNNDADEIVPASYCVTIETPGDEYITLTADDDADMCQLMLTVAHYIGIHEDFEDAVAATIHHLQGMPG